MRQRVKNIDSNSTQLHKGRELESAKAWNGKLQTCLYFTNVLCLIERGFPQFSSSDEPFDIQTYQQAIGCLTYMHTSTATRPDIAAAVGVLSQYVKPK